MKIILLLAAAAAAAAAASVPAQSKQQFSPNGREDLIVEGQAKTLSYEVLDEFGLSSAITAQLRISKVLRGHAPSDVIEIRYIAHMDLPKVELRFHLRRSSTATWLVCKKEGGEGYICE